MATVELRLGIRHVMLGLLILRIGCSTGQNADGPITTETLHGNPRDEHLLESSSAASPGQDSDLQSDGGLSGRQGRKQDRAGHILSVYDILHAQEEIAEPTYRDHASGFIKVATICQQKLDEGFNEMRDCLRRKENDLMYLAAEFLTHFHSGPGDYDDRFLQLMNLRYYDARDNIIGYVAKAAINFTLKTDEAFHLLMDCFSSAAAGAMDAMHAERKHDPQLEAAMKHPRVLLSRSFPMLTRSEEFTPSLFLPGKAEKNAEAYTTSDVLKLSVYFISSIMFFETRSTECVASFVDELKKEVVAMEHGIPDPAHSSGMAELMKRRKAADARSGGSGEGPLNEFFVSKPCEALVNEFKSLLADFRKCWEALAEHLRATEVPGAGKMEIDGK